MKKNENLFILVLGLFLVVLYWRTFSYDLIWDDSLYFEDNLMLTEGRPLGDAFRVGYFAEQMGIPKVDHYYRPLLTASFMAESKLWGIRPETLRIVNLLIFILSLFVLYKLFRSLSERDHFAEIAVLLFAFFPVNMENIVWVVGRGDLLLLLFGGLSFYLLERSILKPKSLIWLAGSAAYLLGMFSKESFLLFWPALLAFDLVRRKRLNIPFHALNAAATVLFFFIKNAALGIRNPRFIQYPVGESLKAAVGTLGYYVKAMVVPISDRFFLATADAKGPIYLVFGFVALALGLVMIWASLKDKKLWPPLVLAASFLAGHVVLIFGSAFPYTVYSRYMMIPALGAVWLAALLLIRLPEKVRYFPVFAAILLFMPSIALNAGAYRSELSFWQKALKASPKDGYVVFQLSKAHYRKKDNIGAEVNLNKALSMPLRKETAILISQLYADISYAKADYAGARKWIESVEEFEAVPGLELSASIKLQNGQRKAKLAISEGRTDEAERVLEESIAMFPAMKPAYADLYSMYLGYEMWEKARALEDRIRSRFPSMAQDCRQVAVQLESMTLEQKIAFYVAHRNFGKALTLAETAASPDLAHKLLVAELSYWLGRSDQGEKAIKDIAAENPARSDVMNSIAAFYLNDLFRPKEALTYLNGSLELDPDQPRIRYLSYELRDRYLGKLTEPWK